MLAKFGYIRGHFQKQLRKIEKTPSGSGGKVTPKWEYFQACSFLTPVYTNMESSSSFELPADDGDVVYEGSLENLLENGMQTVQHPLSMELSSPSSRTPSPLSTGTSTPEPTVTEILGKSKKRKADKTDNEVVKKSMLDTLSAVKSQVAKDDDFVTTCVRSLMAYIPASQTKVKEKFTEKVMKLITETTAEIHREKAESE